MRRDSSVPSAATAGGRSRTHKFLTRRTGGGRRVYSRVHVSLGAALADAARALRAGRKVEIFVGDLEIPTGQISLMVPRVTVLYPVPLTEAEADQSGACSRDGDTRGHRP